MWKRLVTMCQASIHLPAFTLRCPSARAVRQCLSLFTWALDVHKVNSKQFYNVCHSQECGLFGQITLANVLEQFYDNENNNQAEWWRITFSQYTLPLSNVRSDLQHISHLFNAIVSMSQVNAWMGQPFHSWYLVFFVFAWQKIVKAFLSISLK